MSAFISFEGTEGSGKTTQMRLLSEAFRLRGWRHVVTREPGGTPLGNALRSLLLDQDDPISPEAEAYLMTGARAEHVRQIIDPALCRGEIVLCDRFIDSTLAYQGAGRGLSEGVLRSLQILAVGETGPSLTFLLDLPVEIGLRRRYGDGSPNRIDRESLEFHERVAGWYRQEALRNPERWIVIDATRDVALMHTAILNLVNERVAIGLNAPATIGTEPQ